MSTVNAALSRVRSSSSSERRGEGGYVVGFSIAEIDTGDHNRLAECIAGRS